MPDRTSVYNDVNELVSQSGDVTRTLGYDLDGNLTSDGTRTFEWDAENRLTAVTNGTLRSEFSYDGMNRRTRIVEKTNGTALSDRRYIWVGPQIAEERDGNNAVTRRFFPNGFTVGTNKYFYLRDALGSAWNITDNSGAVVASYEYGPFGSVIRSAGTTVDSPIGFCGYWDHIPSGLDLAIFRAYDPQFERWISRDPIAEHGGENLFLYVKNEPPSVADPSGASPGFVLAGGLAVGGAVVMGEFWLHTFLAQGAAGYFPSESDPLGRQKHCYVTCMSVRIHGLTNPHLPLAVGLAHEILTSENFEESLGDLQANGRGVLAQRKSE